MELPYHRQCLLMEGSYLAPIGERQPIKTCAVEVAEFEAGGEDVPEMRLGCVRCVGLIGKVFIENGSSKKDSIGTGIDFVEWLDADARLLSLGGWSSDGGNNRQNSAEGEYRELGEARGSHG